MAINKSKRVRVENRTSGALAYHIDSIRMTRYWRKPGDYLNISIGELLELQTAPGGRKIIENALKIEDGEALKALFPDVEPEPEYHYGEKEIEQLLYHAPIEQLLDALDYAPKGVLDLIRSKATNKLPDTTNKISAIDEKFGIDLIKAHELAKEKDVVKREEKPAPRRRTQPIKTEVKLPKYKVVDK